ncbi:metallophosphoesterase family protein [Robertkochia sediminum]|uniref:metallophosphoesterase family protein n=1 Tax=Robertkochia sediminum TaxID=2785326 RepID=UPI0019339433|nr:metallophosphoesterase family protein [Robertkochia sediminum]MBL7471885.1 serine/threonine protein phosphatase [Robertkochia sediminum]
MAKRTLVIGDIHGALKALDQVLDRAAVTTNDRLIFLGDYVDGWSDAPGVIDKLITLKSSHECVFIRGNHDQLFLNYLQTREENKLWLMHGGQTTVDAYREVTNTRTDLHRQFLEALDNYHLDEKNRLFVHAGFTNLHGVTREYFTDMLFWDRSLWEMALALNPELTPQDPNYPQRLLHYDEIFIGHTPTIRIGKTTPVNVATIWNMDTGAAYRSPLTIMDVDSKEYWQSDRADHLYPDEQGRN